MEKVLKRLVHCGCRCERPLCSPEQQAYRVGEPGTRPSSTLFPEILGEFTVQTLTKEWGSWDLQFFQPFSQKATSSETFSTAGAFDSNFFEPTSCGHPLVSERLLLAWLISGVINSVSGDIRTFISSASHSIVS
ncbi:hypothetical protein CC2G_008485 [Coprinopsis cinerea AmutBmut pab1-1]|nr:hypothetical protein CC2G_008485 [Coprinopsis cinerea AmutBmut pab1-1]